MTPKELLESLNLYDEQARIEAKLASEAGKSMLETVCAFANEPGMGGGWLLLGVRRDERALFPSYEAVGVKDPDKLKSDLVTQCRETFNHPIRIEFEDEMVNEVHLVAAFVPEAEPTEKPVFFKRTGLPAGAFRRVGPSDIHCTEDDLLALYQDRGATSYDETEVKGADLSDLDADAIEDYRVELRKSNPASEILTWPDDELLRALNCVKRDGEKLFPTIAGLLLFGSQKALRRLFPLFRVDYIRVAGTQWMEGGSEPIASIDMRDSLLRLIRRSVAAIMDDLPEAFSLPAGALQREPSSSLPARVVREAVVNALMHRSYRKIGPVQIIRYANRLEIKNPGYSLKPDEEFGESGSVHRNPFIAAVLHETRFAETKGSGIRVIRKLMDEAGLTPPIFESDRDNDQFTVTFFFHHFLEEKDWTWLSAFKDAHLMQEEARALVFVRDNGKISNAAFRDLNKVDTLQASVYLRHLRELGILDQQGKKGPGTYYIGSARFLATLAQETEAKLQEPPGKLQESPAKTQEFPGKLQESRPGAGEIPPALLSRISGLGKKVTKEALEDLILEMCAVRDFSSEELSRLLDRNPVWLLRSYLSPLIAQGRLAYRYPDKPNRPDQKYRTNLAQKE